MIKGNCFICDPITKCDKAGSLYFFIKTVVEKAKKYDCDTFRIASIEIIIDNFKHGIIELKELIEDFERESTGYLINDINNFKDHLMDLIEFVDVFESLRNKFAK